jgi:hypothetical protein
MADDAPVPITAPFGAVVLAPSGLYRVIGHSSSNGGTLYRLEPLEGQPHVIMCEAWRCRVIPRPLPSYPPVKL